MTRINSAINVRRLTDEHLLAEHREIKRMPYCIGKAIASGSVKRIPEKFTMGRGHVLFFLDKMLFVENRYRQLYQECNRRNFNVGLYIDNFSPLPRACRCDYTPTDEEQKLLIERITECIMQPKKKAWHYHGEAITKEQAVELLTDNSK